MSTTRSRLAVAITLLMITAPLSTAGISNWAGPTVVNSNGDATVVTGFRVPGNSSILDGWLHVTNNPMSASSNTGIVWDEDDLDAGYMLGTQLNGDGHLELQDDGTRSNVSNFDVGQIDVSLSSAYTYTPGWRRVFSHSSDTNLSGCGGGNGTTLNHGFDNDFDQNLDEGEILETRFFCETFALDDVVTSLIIDNPGYGYISGNLSASGGGGSGFSGTYVISSGIESITINQGGSGYDVFDAITIACQCDGSGASASVSSITSNGGILSIDIDDPGAGYMASDTLIVIAANGSGADLDANVFSTGVVHSAEILDGGGNYTSPPTIVVSDSNGTGASISANLGGYYDYELEITGEPVGANCSEGGQKVEAGLDLNENRRLDSVPGGTSEVLETFFICHQMKMWQATTFTDLNGSLYGDEQTLAHGVVPSSAYQGLVSAGTMPGSPVPAGTASALVIPKSNVPNSKYINGYYLSFQHWYHIDSGPSGDGDGVWVEYRLSSEENWGNWTYFEPIGGYPSTMSTDAPVPNGATTTPVPVFASSTFSGWVESNFSLTSLDGISDAEQIQFRFQIWTHPNSTNERPGWFLDGIAVNNDGVNVGTWHHGCYNPNMQSCYYSSEAYGALERSIDLSGTNSTSKIELTMEWDLEGSYYDNACVELSLGSGWTDISSSTSSTTSDCSARTGPIPGNGYTADNGQTYQDQSGDLRTVSFDIPSGFQGQSSVDFRIVVDTSAFTNYGGSYPSDYREGVTVSQLRVVDYDGNTLFIDPIHNSSTMTHSGLPDAQGNPAPDDWAFQTLLKGAQSQSFNFEDATANSPTVSDAPGWTRATSMNSGTCTNDRCQFTLNKMSQNSGPNAASSFPYAYGIGFGGNYATYIDEARLISPTYQIPLNGSSLLTFDHWSCSEAAWDGGAVFIKVNNAAWQHFNPGWYTSTIYANAGHNLAGLGAFGPNHCTGTASSGTWTSTSGFTTMSASLDNFRGDNVSFKFAFGSDAIWGLAGWYIDNAGVRIANYGETGHWLSPIVQIGSDDRFNFGFVDIDAEIHDESWIRGSVLEAGSGQVITGFSNISFPFSLAGIDSETYPEIRLKIHMRTENTEMSPVLKNVYIGADRVLNADSGYNGWEMSSGVEVVDGLLNATAVTGTVSSEYVHSSRPIKSVTIRGNISSGVVTTLFDSRGNQLGSVSMGGSIEFPSPQNGYAVSVNLPTNGWIDVLRISARFSNPASNPIIDVLHDGTTDWSFPLNDGYGHFGWQSLVSDPEGEFSGSTPLNLDGTNAEELVFLIPESGSVTSGLVAISPDSDGFEGPVTVTIAGSMVTGGSGNSPFLTMLSQGQMTGIGFMSASHTDPVTGRQWLEVPLEINSAVAQSVSLTSIGIGYQFFENLSGLGPMMSAYHDIHTSDDPPPEELAIPIGVTADYGSVAIDGSVSFDYMFVNRDFSVPNTLYPDDQVVEVVTMHHHLNDNSQIAEITLTGTGSDGSVVSFVVENSADGLWGSGGSSATFSQTSGNGLAPIDTSMSYVEEVLHSDGYVDIVVHWFFEVTWNWDDVDDIHWIARANDEAGETIWPASTNSGMSGKNAVENDLQIDSFTVLDADGRLVSNIYDTLFYPFHILDGGGLNISGTVRFQDSTDRRPLGSDFSVALNISGSIYPLETGDDGTFWGVVSAPPGIDGMAISPLLISVGRPGASTGAEDVTGQPPIVDLLIDQNPPVAGPLEVLTQVGLQPVDGMVVNPTTAFSPSITISEGEARGDLLTLRYWRTGVDDADGDGLADEEEYQSQHKPLSEGLTGEQWIEFSGIDVSTLDNEFIYLYVEGTDWAGLSYQDGGTGGGAGALNSWASVVVAVDEPTSFAGTGLGTGQGSSTFGLDRQTQDSIDYYLIPGKEHTFSVRLDEPNGFRTIDNITVMLCGYGSDLGMFSYEPFTSDLWAPEDSMLNLIGAVTEQITATVVELRVSFSLSWDFPFTVEEFDCKPRVVVEDGLQTLESDVLSSLSWRLDNRLIAVPESASDLTPPLVDSQGVSLFLGQGDEFLLSGFVYHLGSGELLNDVPSDLSVQLSMIYGTENRLAYSEVLTNGSFEISMILPSRPPLDPTMTLTTSLIGTPGASVAIENSEASVTVDTSPPTALFNLDAFPDSSLTLIETNLIGDIPVTVTIVEAIGMVDGPLQVSWEYSRGGQVIAGTESSGELAWISSSDGKHIYQGQLDFTPEVEMRIEEGDQIAFWITSTDKAGNPVIGLGGPDAPRMPTLRVVEFLWEYTREVVTPTKTPYQGETLTIVTYWENPGKLDGTFQVGLYEQKSDGSWLASKSTLLNGDQEVYLPPQSSSIKVQFEYEAAFEGQPFLVLVVNGDFDNENFNNVEISGITVEKLDSVNQESSGTVWIIAGLLLVISLMGLAFYIIQSRGDDYYYDDENWEEYEEEDGE